MAYGTQTPWATGATSTTDQLAQQLQPGQSFTQSGNPLYNGAYNPMYHAAEGQKITMKDLASLYYKQAGAGVVGDNPHPFHAANVYRDALNVHGGIPGLSDMGPDMVVKSPEDVKAQLQAQIDLAGGNKQAVFDQLVNKTNTRQIADTAKKAGVSPSEAIALQGKAPAAKDPSQSAISAQWMQDYVSPYIAQQQAEMQFHADMFDSVASSIIPTMDPDKAAIMKAYLPLISQAYHQQADQFGYNFLSGNDRNSLIGNLLANQKRNASAAAFLTGQNGGSSGGSSFITNAIKNLG